VHFSSPFFALLPHDFLPPSPQPPNSQPPRPNELAPPFLFLYTPISPLYSLSPVFSPLDLMRHAFTLSFSFPIPQISPAPILHPPLPWCSPSSRPLHSGSPKGVFPIHSLTEIDVRTVPLLDTPLRSVAPSSHSSQNSETFSSNPTLTPSCLLLVSFCSVGVTLFPPQVVIRSPLSLFSL